MKNKSIGMIGTKQSVLDGLAKLKEQFGSEITVAELMYEIRLWIFIYFILGLFILMVSFIITEN